MQVHVRSSPNLVEELTAILIHRRCSTLQVAMSTEPHAEPHNTVRPEPEAEYFPEPVSEPVPVWGKARETWGWAWELHWAGFGAMFFLLSLYALLHVSRMVGTGWKPRRLLALFVNCLLVLLGLTRALFLFINPYESDECHVLVACPIILTRILFGIGLPCLTASFSLIHLAFLQVTKLKLYPAKLQSGKFLASVILFHFTLAIVTEVVISLHADGKALSIACQSFFIFFSFLLSASYIYSGRKILSCIERSTSQMQRMGKLSVGSRKREPSRETARTYRPNVSKLVKITYTSVFLGFSSCALQLYSIFHVYNMYSGQYQAPEPWPWLIFQSLSRVVEFAAGCTMAYVSPRQVSKTGLKLPCFPDRGLDRFVPVPSRNVQGSIDGQTSTSNKMQLPNGNAKAAGSASVVMVVGTQF